jgi:hypothetical protein
LWARQAHLNLPHVWWRFRTAKLNTGLGVSGGFIELSGIVLVPVSAAIAPPVPAKKAIAPVAGAAMPSIVAVAAAITCLRILRTPDVSFDMVRCG